jgi:myo-inositol 2-dehydrogenase / D-chiro-inositol 1-dehydrogenase
MSHPTRREFLEHTTVGAAAAAGLLVLPHPARALGTQASSAISLGMIGSGGRGAWIGNLFMKTGKFHLAACHDYYQARVDTFGEKFDVPAERRFTGLEGYRRLLDLPLDAVVIQSPPYFHPEQAAAAVAARKHVFLSKPIAVDAPGCLSVAESGRTATANERVLLVDFQTRADAIFQETLRRVHAGAIGRLISADGNYPWSRNVHDEPLPSPDERLRMWYQSPVLSGDTIVEQDIHTLDVATWFAGADPLAATGRGGRATRRHGDTWDHFSVLYEFPEEFSVSFTSQKGVPGARDEIRCRVYGTEGMADTDYTGSVSILGKNPYEGGRMDGLFTRGAERNIETFWQAITEGRFDNPTVAPSVRSNLTAVLGRTAAYRGGRVTWQEMLAASERLPFDTTGLTP